MAKAKNASTVGIHLPNPTIAEIDRRAALVGYSRSRYVGALVQRWYARGAEPILVIEQEKLDPIMKPDGSLTWLGAGLKPGASITEFAADASAVYGMVAERPPSPKKTG